jgi:hypothetical protein
MAINLRSDLRVDHHTNHVGQRWSVPPFFSRTIAAQQTGQSRERSSLSC